MTTFVLVHGSGDGGWALHLLRRALRERGHDAVAPDLPNDRDDVTWQDCVDVLVRAADGAPGTVVVGHSSGGFLAPLAADRLGSVLQVHVAGMVPRPGESPADWFAHVGWPQEVARAAARDGGRTGSADPAVLFYHDVPASLAARARARERPTSGRLGAVPWPAAALPAVPARYVVTTGDRFIPPPVQRRVAAERLGVRHPQTLDAGHCAPLSRPAELAALLVAHLDDVAGRPARGMTVRT